MAFYARKPWNEHPVVIGTGAAVRFSGNGSILYVLDAEGTTIARFIAKSVQEHWIENDSESSTK